jgi:hypothetical protein
VPSGSGRTTAARKPDLDGVRRGGRHGDYTPQ